MQSYDLIMIIVLAAAALFGAWKGFVWQLASVASMVASYIVAYQFREPLAAQLTTQFQAPAPWNMFLSMLILFLGTGIAVWIGFGLIHKTIDQLKLKDFDRQIGAAVGLVKGGLICIIITFFGLMLLGDNEKKTIVNSHSGRLIAKVIHQAEPVLPREVHTVLDPYLQKLEDQLDPGLHPGRADAPLPWPSGSKLVPANLDFPPPAGGEGREESGFGGFTPRR